VPGLIADFEQVHARGEWQPCDRAPLGRSCPAGRWAAGHLGRLPRDPLHRSTTSSGRRNAPASRKRRQDTRICLTIRCARRLSAPVPSWRQENEGRRPGQTAAIAHLKETLRLSPVATQHSLPSGRYPLLEPDFHRLDRTSLRLAHSLDHLVGAQENRRRDREFERLRRPEV
jgi:hypothetical protein